MLWRAGAGATANAKKNELSPTNQTNTPGKDKRGTRNVVLYTLLIIRIAYLHEKSFRVCLFFTLEIRFLHFFLYSIRFLTVNSSDLFHQRHQLHKLYLRCTLSRSFTPVLHYPFAVYELWGQISEAHIELRPYRRRNFSLKRKITINNNNKMKMK